MKGNQWYFGMKAHIGVDAGTGYVHSVTATAASVHDLDQIAHLVRADDDVVYADAGYQGAERRPDVAGDPHLSKVGSPGMNVGQDLVLGLKAPVLQGFRGSGGLLGDAHVW